MMLSIWIRKVNTHLYLVSSHFVNSHFVNSHLVNSHLVNVDKVGIDKVGINHAFHQLEKHFQSDVSITFGNLHLLFSNLVNFTWWKLPKCNWNVGLKLFLKLVKSLTKHHCLIVYHASTMMLSKTAFRGVTKYHCKWPCAFICHIWYIINATWTTLRSLLL